MNVQHRGDLQTQPIAHRPPSARAVGQGLQQAVRSYSLVVTALPDAGGPHKPVLALRRHLPVLEYLARQVAAPGAGSAQARDEDARRLAEEAGLPYERVRQLLEAGTGDRRANPLLRPLVLRASCGEVIQATVTNLLPGVAFSLALLDDDYGIQPPADMRPPVPPGQRDRWVLQCTHTGIFPIFNRACPDDAQRRCLIGVLIVEP